MKKIFIPLLLAVLASAPFAFGGNVSAEAAARLVRRVVPAAADKVVFEEISGVPASEKLVYELETAADGKLIVRGNATVALTSGFYQFLKEFCRSQITQGANNIGALANGGPLPRVPAKIRVESPLVIRFAYNFCTHGYTTAWWNFEQWEREIDLLALHGFNVALVVAGYEAVWQNTFARFGFSREEARRQLSAPSHLPWQIMGNVEALFPPPQSTIDARARLGRAIAARMRELGIEPVLQGFYGIVPHDFREKHAAARVIPQGNWVGGNARPALLDADDPLFAPLACAFYEEQKKIYGECRFFAADPFHEGGNGGSAERRGKVFRKIQDAMLEFEPAGTLVKQCWQTANTEMFAAARRERVLALDLYCDKAPFWKNSGGFGGTPWIWCVLQNFGGNSGLEGDLRGICNGLREAMSAPAAETPTGVGFVPEGAFGNPVVPELLSDIAVRGAVPESVETWLADYVRSRYGKDSPALERAWQILLETVCAHTSREGPINSALPARPRFGSQIKARAWAPDALPPYETARLCEALRLFESEKENFAEIPTFRFDIAEIRRQIIGELSLAVHARINAAWSARDAEKFADAARDFMRLFALSAERFDAFPQFAEADCAAFGQSLEKMLADAASLGATREEKSFLQKCAKTLLTTWVADAGTELEDYANREWPGLLRDYYARRWEIFFEIASEALAAGTDFDDRLFDERLNAFERAWIAAEKPSPRSAGSAEMSQNAPEEIAALIKKYAGTRSAAEN